MSTEITPAPSRSIRPVEDHSAAAHLFDTARFEHMFRIAKAMATATLIPDHLWKDKQGQLPPEQVQGNCFLIVNQSVRWGLDPFAVAPETYSVSGKLGFQGKLIAAVVNTRAGLQGRLSYSFEGKGEDLTVTVSGTFQGEAEPRTAALSVKDAKTGNEMWRKDPEQKLIYSGVTKWARRHCPEVILGVLTDDDVERIAESNGLPLPSSQVNYDDEHERAMQQWRIDCQAMETYNAKLKSQGVPEDQWEEMPPMPVQSESTSVPQPESSAPVVEAIPWQEVKLTQFRALKGKALGELSLEDLINVRDAINRTSPVVRQSKGLSNLIDPVAEGIKALTPVPAKATPAEGLRNLMKDAGVTEEALLEYWSTEKRVNPGSFRNLETVAAEEIITAWPEIVRKLKATSAKDGK